MFVWLLESLDMAYTNSFHLATTGYDDGSSQLIRSISRRGYNTSNTPLNLAFSLFQTAHIACWSDELQNKLLHVQEQLNRDFGNSAQRGLWPLAFALFTSLGCETSINMFAKHWRRLVGDPELRYKT